MRILLRRHADDNHAIRANFPPLLAAQCAKSRGYGGSAPVITTASEAVLAFHLSGLTAGNDSSLSGMRELPVQNGQRIVMAELESRGRLDFLQGWCMSTGVRTGDQDRRERLREWFNKHPAEITPKVIVHAFLGLADESNRVTSPKNLQHTKTQVFCKGEEAELYIYRWRFAFLFINDKISFDHAIETYSKIADLQDTSDDPFVKACQQLREEGTGQCCVLPRYVLICQSLVAYKIYDTTDPNFENPLDKGEIAHFRREVVQYLRLSDRRNSAILKSLAEKAPDFALEEYTQLRSDIRDRETGVRTLQTLTVGGVLTIMTLLFAKDPVTDFIPFKMMAWGLPFVVLIPSALMYTAEGFVIASHAAYLRARVEPLFHIGMDGFVRRNVQQKRGAWPRGWESFTARHRWVAHEAKKPNVVHKAQEEDAVHKANRKHINLEIESPDSDLVEKSDIWTTTAVMRLHSLLLGMVMIPPFVMCFWPEHFITPESHSWYELFMPSGRSNGEGETCDRRIALVMLLCIATIHLRCISNMGVALHALSNTDHLAFTKGDRERLLEDLNAEDVSGNKAAIVDRKYVLLRFYNAIKTKIGLAEDPSD